MSISERRTHIINQINAIEDEDTLSILEEAISYYATGSQKDVTDDLSDEQFQELKAIIEEPSDKDTISQEDFNKIFARWSTKDEVLTY